MESTIETTVLKGKYGKPIGKMLDGRVILFDHVPNNFAVGVTATCEVVIDKPNYVIANVVLVKTRQAGALEAIKSILARIFSA